MIAVILYGSFTGGQAAATTKEMLLFHTPTVLELPSEKDELSHVVPCGDGLGLVYGGTSLSFFPHNGLRLSWKKDLSGDVEEVRCIDDQLVAMGQDMTSFDAVSGEMRWNYPLTGMKLLGVHGSLAVIAGFAPTFGQVMVISLRNGEHRWRSWQVVSGVRATRVERGDVLVLSEQSGTESRMKLNTGRLLSAPKRNATVRGAFGLAGYPAAEPKQQEETTSAWGTIGQFNEETWLKSEQHLLLMGGGTPPQVLGEHSGKIFARVGDRIFSVASTPLEEWAEGCKTELGLPGEKGEQCGRFLTLSEPDLMPVQDQLKEVVSRQLRRSCEQAENACGLWTRWLESVMVLDTSSAQGEKGTRARELGLLAIQLGVQGEFESARRLVSAVTTVPGPRWDVLIFGLASMEAREVLEAGKTALRQGRSAEALAAVQTLEDFEAMQSLLPESIVDAGDGRSLLKQAIRDLDEVIPEVAPNGQSQGVCLFRCRLMADLDGRQSADQGCTAGCVL